MADTDEPGWVEKLGNENPVLLLILGMGAGVLAFWVINKYMQPKA